MNELSLFSGAGGGLLATKFILGWRAVGYVEWNEYCQRVIRARIDDGYLDSAPIFGDIRVFLSEGYAERYRGMVDVITAGFPCQPFSTAGKRYGADDERNMWPATIKCIRVVRPRFCLLENVPGLLNVGYFGAILGDLAESGYDAQWKILSAAELGAPHKRDRLWIVAYDTQFGDGSVHVQSGKQESENIDADGGCKAMAHAECGRFNREQRRWTAQQFENSSANVANTAIERAAAVKQYEQLEEFEQRGSLRITEGTGLENRMSCSLGSKSEFERPNWWATEPDVGRVVNGLAYRMDRLKALGNGQVPAVVGCIWEILSGLMN